MGGAGGCQLQCVHLGSDLVAQIKRAQLHVPLHPPAAATNREVAPPERLAAAGTTSLHTACCKLAHWAAALWRRWLPEPPTQAIHALRRSTIGALGWGSICSRAWQLSELLPCLPLLWPDGGASAPPFRRCISSMLEAAAAA